MNYSMEIPVKIPTEYDSNTFVHVNEIVDFLARKVNSSQNCWFSMYRSTNVDNNIDGLARKANIVATCDVFWSEK